MSTTPWSTPVPHPLTVADSPLADYVPYPATITGPLTVGGNLQTGDPLQVTLRDQHGAKIVHVSGPVGSGRTVLFGNLAERVTACLDAVLLQVGGGKVAARDGAAWEPLAGASEYSPGDACRILRFAYRCPRTQRTGRQGTQAHPGGAAVRHRDRWGRVPGRRRGRRPAAAAHRSQMPVRGRGAGYRFAAARSLVGWSPAQPRQYRCQRHACQARRARAWRLRGHRDGRQLPAC